MGKAGRLVILGIATVLCAALVKYNYLALQENTKFDAGMNYWMIAFAATVWGGVLVSALMNSSRAASLALRISMAVLCAPIFVLTALVLLVHAGAGVYWTFSYATEFPVATMSGGGILIVFATAIVSGCILCICYRPTVLDN
jgi:hypothetical protein